MCLYFVIMNGFARSEEVVTEPALHVSCCISILRITLTKHAMFEIAQIIDVQEVIENFVLSSSRVSFMMQSDTFPPLSFGLYI